MSRDEDSAHAGVPDDQLANDPEHEAKIANLDAFQQLLARLWGRLTELIGPMATAGIIRMAWRDTTRRHVVLANLAITDNGMATHQLRKDLGAVSWADLSIALSELVDAILQMLGDLTGEVLMRKIDPIVAEFWRRPE